MARTACSEACLAVYLHEKSLSVSRALAAHVTAPLSSARSRRKSQLDYFLFGLVARLPVNLRAHLGSSGPFLAKFVHLFRSLNLKNYATKFPPFSLLLPFQLLAV